MSRASPAPSPHPVADVGAWLVGRWELRRTLNADDGTPLGRFTGELVVTRDAPGRATAVERGLLEHDGHRLEASRTLRYALHDDGTASVTFDHGGHFHDLDLRTGTTDVVHPCAPDTYRGRTEVADDDAWVQTWHVSGPAKAYVSVTRATRTDERRDVAAAPRAPGAGVPSR